MRSFDTIKDAAIARKGSAEALQAALADSPVAREISGLGDNRVPSEFSKRVFQAGFNWSVIENKWDGHQQRRAAQRAGCVQPVA